VDSDFSARLNSALGARRAPPGRPPLALRTSAGWAGRIYHSRRVNDETEVASVTARYPPADITPAEFERFVAELFGSAATEVEDLEVRVLDTIKGVDGSYVFDATVRFTVAGLQMLVVVEAKHHGRSVERSYVQILHDKLRSVGAHKAVLVSTASFQRGALEYAGVHGIALVTVTEGRFLFLTRSRDTDQAPTREHAAERFGVSTFVAHAYRRTDTGIEIKELDGPDAVAEALLGIEPGHPPAPDA